MQGGKKKERNGSRATGNHLCYDIATQWQREEVSKKKKRGETKERRRKEKIRVRGAPPPEIAGGSAQQPSVEVEKG